MPNIIEESRRKTRERESAEAAAAEERRKLTPTREQVEQQAKQTRWENRAYNYQFFRRANSALIESGVMTTLNEIAINENGHVSNFIELPSLDINHWLNSNLESGKLRISNEQHVSFYVSWRTPTRPEDKEYRESSFFVSYRADDTLKFTAQFEGDKNCIEDKHTHSRSKILTNNQWKNETILAATIEAAYKSPTVQIHPTHPVVDYGSGYLP